MMSPTHLHSESNQLSSSTDSPPNLHLFGGPWSALPKTLVVRVISFCEPAEIVALACLSRRFNTVVTQHVLLTRGVKRQPSGIEIFLYRPFSDSSTPGIGFDEYLIPQLLAISFWIESVNYLYYHHFDLPFHTIVHDLWHVAGLVSRLPEPSVDLLVLDFQPIRPGALVKGDVEQLEARWEDATTRILEVVTSKRVRDFRIYGGGGLPRDISHHSEEDRPQRAKKQMSTDKEVSTEHAGAETGKYTTLFKHLLSPFGRKSKILPVATKSPSPAMDLKPPSHTLPITSDAPFEVDLSSFLTTSSSSFLPPLLSNNVPDVTTTRSLPDNVLERREALYLDCPVLLLPPHTQRTVQLIKSRTYNLTVLSLSNHNLDWKTWKDVLGHIQLPFLNQFIIRSGPLVRARGAPVHDLVGFLKRHATITHLEMHGMEVVSVHDTLSLKAPLLPNLSHLSAHSSYVALIVDSHTRVYLHDDLRGASINTFPSPLRSITITSETPIWKIEAFDRISPPGRVIRALKAISHLPFSNSLQLSIEYSPSGGIIHKVWMERMIKEGKASVCSRLHHVRSLVLECSYNVLFSRQEIDETLPALFNLFPGGIEVTCTKIGGCEGMGGRDIEELWARKCPRVRKFEVTGAWMLETSAADAGGENLGVATVLEQGVDDGLANHQVAA